MSSFAHTSDALRTVHVRAPGKINLMLHVGAVQSDGYHPLATVFQAVSLYEDVYAHLASELSVSFRGSVDTTGLVGDDTLVHRAARLVAGQLSEAQREALNVAPGHLPGVRIVVEKHVPIAGGMGGGSADAAATLLACNDIWNVGLDRAALIELAAELGADVPFALQGGTAMGVGRGDVLTPLLAGAQSHWVLVTAPFGLSTPAVYGQLDIMRAAGNAPSRLDHPTVPAETITAIRDGDYPAYSSVLDNDLQIAAFTLEPRLREQVRRLEQQTALGAIVSGSGPTIALLAPDEDSAQRVAAEVGGIAVVGGVPGARILSRDALIDTAE